LVGTVMRMVVALSGVEGAVVVVVVDEELAPNPDELNAETHDPTVTLARVAATVWLKVVVEV